MVNIVIRVTFIYIIVLFFLRLMGKRQIGEMQPFELVFTLIMADIATIPMSDNSIPIISGILPLAILVVLHYLIIMFSRKSAFFKKIVSGSPVILINPEGIDYKELMSLNMTIDDLQEGLRMIGYSSFEQVRYAILETNGTLTAFSYNEYSPITLNITKNKTKQNYETELPYYIINDGKIDKVALENAKITEKKVEKILSKNNIKNKNNVLVMTINKNNEIYLQEKEKKFRFFKLGEN